MEVNNEGEHDDLAVLSSLPDGGVTDEMVRSLGASDVFDEVFPFAGYPETSIRTHIVLQRGDNLDILGWDPDKEEWQRIAEVIESGDPPDIDREVRVIRKTDDETGEVLVDPWEHIEESDGEDENIEFLQGLFDYATAYGKVSFDETSERQPMFYAEELDLNEL